MPLYQAIVLAIVQGITEFLPVSSTAHLVLVPWFLGWQDPGLTFDIAVHAGTLVAVLAYFRRDWVDLFKAGLGWGDPSSEEIRENRRLLFYLAVATVPGGLAGFFLKSFAENDFRHPFVIAGALIFVALIMWQADRRSGLRKNLGKVTLADALIVGLAQATAIVPGVSRSGATITAGLFLHMRREAAARFSFLLSTPLIGGAALKTGLEVWEAGLAPAMRWPFAVGMIVSALVGYLVIFWFLRYLQQSNFRIFVVYRLALGVLILALGMGMRYHLW